jgi:hypothetical protein
VHERREKVVCVRFLGELRHEFRARVALAVEKGFDLLEAFGDFFVSLDEKG